MRVALPYFKSYISSMIFSLKKNKKGFSLVEVLMTMLVFTIILVGVAGYFTNIVRANQNSRRILENMEDVRFAMSRVSKILRTSVVIRPSGGGSANTLRVFDYSQRKCLEYTFTAGEIREAVSVGSVPSGAEGIEKLWCGETGGAPAMTLSSPISIVSSTGGASFSGSFTVYPSNVISGSEQAGRVVMNVTVSRENNSSTLQTTVSLRNFTEVAP